MVAEVGVGLEVYGWDERRGQDLSRGRDQGWIPARVIAGEARRYSLASGHGILVGEVSGRFRHDAADPRAFPAVGDWVLVDARPEEGKGTIHEVLPRHGVLSRKAAGTETVEQVVAANLDAVILVMGLDGDFSLRRAERYLAAILSGGIRPLIVLNKADLCPDADRRACEMEAVAGGAPIHVVSAARGEGLEALRRHVQAGETVALVGSSGAGKSTLANWLLGEPRLPVGEVREGDGKGRHTTTRRELLLLPGGGMIVDCPGLREFQPWELGEAFEEVEALAKGCRFRDCRHGEEPGCTVRLAISEGRLEPGRFGNYLRLQREEARLATRKRQRALLLERRQRLQWKKGRSSHDD